MYDDFTPGKPLRIYDKDGNWKDFNNEKLVGDKFCLLYTSPSPRDRQKSRMPSSA